MESAAAAAKCFSIKSSRLFAWAQQLRAYEPPISSSLDEAEESTRKLISHVGSPVKIAAVLICLFEGDDGEDFLQGGKAEEHDKDDGITATREPEEEIGLDASLVDVVTFLEPFLSQDENRRSKEIEWIGKSHLLHFFDYNTGDKHYVIWGLTARILITAASVVYQRPPAFIEQKPNLKYPQNVNADQAASFYGQLKVLSSCVRLAGTSCQISMNLLVKEDR